MNGTSAILYAYTIDGDGRGHVLQGDDISREIKDQQLAWVHMDATHPETRGWLEREVSYLDPLILDALLAEETRPRVLEFEKGALVILRGMNLNDNAEPEDMIGIRMWIDESRIISLRRRKLKAAVDMKERLESGNGPKNAGDFLAMLSTRLFERMEPVLGELDEQTDNIEERILEHPDVSERQQIIDIRKQAILFRRYIAPQRDVIGHLRSADLPWLDTRHKRHLQESWDRLTRYIEDLDAIRERAQIIKDELANALADRLNKNMYLLSVIAAIFLPLGFLTGLLGINVGGIPGADNPQSFTVFCIMLTAIIAVQIAVFKKLKWF